MAAGPSIGPRRHLAAILAADVVGYSRQMGIDEAGTLARLTACRTEVVEPVVARHAGRIVKLMGDGALSEFPSVVEAVQAAIEIQAGMAERNRTLPEEARLLFRLGINLGDVIEDEGDVYGDGVNIAARLEALAEPGGIVLSRSVHSQVKGKLAVDFQPMGPQRLKNIAEPVEVWRIAGACSAPRLRAPRSWRVALAASVVLLLMTGAGTWLIVSRPGAAHPPQAAAADAEPVPADTPSIAVLPLDNLSGDPAQEYFADGMTEDLITDLARLPNLFVIARNSSWTYKGKPVKVQEVARDLGVRYVLEGSVQRQGDQLRINAQLIDAGTGHHVWAERYDGTLGDVFALQDRVIAQIVSSLAVNLDRRGTESITAAETDNEAAYDELLQGWGHYRRASADETNLAIAHFARALELDPDYGRAHAALAAAYWRKASLAWDFAAGSEWEGDFESMSRHLAKALEKPTTVAYWVSAEMLSLEGRYAEAMADAERAIALAPSEPDSYVSKARILNETGQSVEAEATVRTAMRLDPRHPTDYLRVLGEAQFNQQNYDDAAATMERVVGQDPDVYPDYTTLAATYGYLGRRADAATAMQKYTELAVRSGYSPFTIEEQGYWWYTDMFDYDPAYRDRLLEGLRRAGAPEGAGTGVGFADQKRLMRRSGGEYTVDGAPTIDAPTARTLRDRGVAFVDVRAASSFAAGHIPGSVNLNLNTELSRESLSRVVGMNDEVVFTCYGRHCSYSAYASAKALLWGFTHVEHFAGGFPAWQAAGYPVEVAPSQ